MARIQFMKTDDADLTVVAEFKIPRTATKEEEQKIEELIYQAKDEAEENDEDFDLYNACYEAVDKVLGVVSDWVTNTIYI